MTRGFATIGVYQPKTEANVGTLWRTAFAFGVALVFTVGRRYQRQASDTVATPRHVPLLHFSSMADLREHLPHGTPLIGVELTDEATPVRAFHHPERAAYLLGAEDHGLSPAVLAMCHRIVVLPGRHCLNVAVAGSLILYDRWLRGALSDRATSSLRGVLVPR